MDLRASEGHGHQDAQILRRQRLSCVDRWHVGMDQRVELEQDERLGLLHVGRQSGCRIHLEIQR